MGNWSIVTKIVASACGIVCVLVLLGGFVLIKFEINLVDRFTAETLSRIHEFIDDRAEEEKKALREEIRFSVQILSGIGSSYLYNLDQEGLKESLRPYMEYPELRAIKVMDDKGKPFAAAWKSSVVITGNALPGDLNLGGTMEVAVDCVYNGKKVGTFHVYYSDALLMKRIERQKKDAVQRTELFESAARERLNRAIASQTVGIFAILLVLVVSLILFLRALVLRPLKQVSEVAHKLSEFDLTVGINTTRKDEIGDLLRAIDEMAASFREVVGQVQRSGIQVTSSSTELAATAREQEATMANQVKSTSRVVKSVEQISEVATELVDTMDQVAARSQETAGFASKGQTDLARMEEAMANMGAASRSISGRLEAINEKAENITDVVTTITKVADKTNLLSLNAAIEAEKAGEYGRGFNVVAREIRRLADQTAVATLDIDQMVQEMQTAVSAGVMEMDKFIAEVNRSTEDVGRISLQLTRIIEQVQALSPSFENVTVAMGRQSENAKKINLSMTNLDEEMHEIVNSLRETYSAIEQLNEAARDLQDQVSRFRVE
ncbi:MAG TPA: methyl-accepting chemotaxis protein [Deltaproteobacteria bacterium]|nr:methyl-accepting chemotaxis protein [Deltaproteobacteria bacterium]